MIDEVDEPVAEVVEDVIDEVIEDVDADEVDADEAESETADSEEEASEVDEPSESSTEKKDDGFEKRAAEITSKFYNEKQQKEHYKRQYDELVAQQQPAPPSEPGKSLADFEYDEVKFSGYLTDQARQAAHAEVEKGHQQEQQFKRRAEFEMKEAAFEENAKDYQAVTRSQTLAVTETMVEALQSSDKGPAVLYYLGKNPEVASSIAQMAPLDAARELGKIEATKLVAPTPPTSKTPAPVPKIKASDTSAIRVKSNTAASDKLSDAEWLKRENKRLGYS
jgi:hypothetical protein